jgi:hypothetical protein
MELKDLEKRFMYHEVNDNKEERMADIRIATLELAMLINDVAPESREKPLSITHLEEVVFWANSAISRND